MPKTAALKPPVPLIGLCHRVGVVSTTKEKENDYFFLNEIPSTDQ